MQSTLDLLPPRPKPKGKLEIPGSKMTKLSTNLYQISLKRSPNLYQYTVDVQPSIDDHAVSFLRKLIHSKKQELKKQIGFITSKGRTLWGTKIASKVIVSKIKKDSQKIIPQNYEMIIKHTRTIAYAEIATLKANQFRQIQQIYTVALRQKLFKMGLKETLRNRFIQTGQGEMIKGYTILQCCYLRLVPIIKKINLLVDIGFRLLNQKNALQELQDCKGKQAKERHANGKIVVTTYNNRSYKVQRICFDKNPKQSFYHQRRGKNMTFLEYFQEYYKITPYQLDQPLFQTIIDVRYQIKGETKVKIQTKGYLIPQFCKFAATLSAIKNTDLHSFGDISKKIKISPQQRKIKQLNLITQINKSVGQFQVTDSSTEAEAFVYEDITAIGKKPMLCYNGTLKDMRQIKQPGLFYKDQILFVYSNPDNDKSQYKYVSDLFDDLAYSAKYYNIDFKDFEFVEVRDFGAKFWTESINKFFCKKDYFKKTMRIIILLFDNSEKKFYGDLKKYITNQLALPCQVILRNTISHKNKTSILGKIALQINAKCGNTLWSIQTKHPFWSKRKVAYGAFSVAKNIKQFSQSKKGTQLQNKMTHVIGFVGTCSQDFSQIYANAVLVDKQQELRTVKPFQEILADWLKNYKSKQEMLPEIIIIYREGLTEKQIQTQARVQVEAIHQVVNRAKSKYPDYDPQIIYILVSKKSSKRLYRPQRSQGSGKFAPIVMGNPIPGTIVFEQISSDQVYDFHMAAQSTTQGTATLTSYLVAYDDSKTPQQALAQFTMQQCYNYPNWQGGICVPGCLQSANRLSKLVGEHIHQNITQKMIDYENSSESLRNKPFYL